MVSTALAPPVVDVSGKQKGGGLPPPPASEDFSRRRTTDKNQIVILVSAPLVDEELSGVVGLSIQSEIDGIVRVIGNHCSDIAIEITVKIATTETLLEVFSSRSRPLVIHFIGHGMQTDNGVALLLEDRAGKARRFSVDELNTLLSSRSVAPCQVAVLNACHSAGLASALIGADVPHIVAVNAEERVLDDAARCFAQTFYQALFNGWQMIEAFEQGRSAVKVNDDLRQLFNPRTLQQGVNFEESLKFKLLPGNSAVHRHGLELHSMASGSVSAPLWERTNLASHDPMFVGRRLLMYQIMSEFVSGSKGRCIALHGIGGMGKTALALAVGRWQHERSRWRDGVWFVGLRNVSTVAMAIAQISDTLELGLEESLIPALIKVLRNQERLLILDDLDRLLDDPDEEGELIDLLTGLLGCSSIGVLTTSRIGLPDEVAFHLLEVQGLDSTETMQAFCNYAPNESEWGADTDSLELYEALMQTLDGYPLPIRLAASYLKRRSLGDLCEVLEVNSAKALSPLRRRATRDNSLAKCLDISYALLPPQVRELFGVLSLFPGGLSRDLACHLLGTEIDDSIDLLLEYSMAERSETASKSERRIRLPEPARQYAETKREQGIDAYGRDVLIYFYESITQLVNAQNSDSLRTTLLLESANLIYFLHWGYEHERSGSDRCCYSARLVKVLSDYWQWVRPTESPIDSLERGLASGQRNGDTLAQADIYVAIGDILARCEEREDALIAYLDANKLYSASRPVQVADVLLKVGQLQEQAGDLEDALKSYKAAKRLYGEQKYQPGVEKSKGLIFRVRRQIDPSAFGLLPFEFTTVLVDCQGRTFNRERLSRHYFLENLPNRIGLEMVDIPGGSFLMGSPSDELERFDRESPQHRVTVEPFMMGRYPLTQAQWRAIVSLPKVNRKLKSDPSRFKGDNHPVERVCWKDAVEACERLSSHTGHEYRLPSEAEWEYACRAGTQTPFSYGETITTEIANYYGHFVYGEGPKGEYRRTTTSVDYFPYANAFGLSDMHGNVREWCQDSWNYDYQSAPLDGSAWQEDPSNNSGHIMRGGSWSDGPGSCRSAYRYWVGSVERSNFLGFRVVLSVSRTQ
ncbi:MAG: SUMF1/EgtB/PvdO family nonheme iron enzyme [Cyanobacteria bacterium P01_F01_bin.150]